MGFKGIHDKYPVPLHSLEWSWAGGAAGGGRNGGPSLIRETVDGVRSPTLYAHRFIKRFTSAAKVRNWTRACESGRVLRARWEMAGKAEIECGG